MASRHIMSAFWCCFPLKKGSDVLPLVKFWEDLHFFLAPDTPVNVLSSGGFAHGKRHKLIPKNKKAGLVKAGGMRFISENQNKLWHCAAVFHPKAAAVFFLWVRTTLLHVVPQTKSLNCSLNKEKNTWSRWTNSFCQFAYLYRIFVPISPLNVHKKKNRLLPCAFFVINKPLFN